LNHFDEMTCLSYLEGQLDPERARELVAHVAGCSQCRAVLQTLQRETSLLAMALTEANESVPARLLATPGWRISSWIWTVSFGLFAAGAFWLWTGTISPWLQQLSTAGFGGTDMLTMLVVSGAFWEGWSDMIDLLQIAGLLILGGVAFSLLRRHFRRSTVVGITMMVLSLALIAPQRAAAAEVRRGETVLVPQTETIHNDLIVGGESVHIDGTVEGDVIAFTRDLTVTGHVTGDLIAFAGQMHMQGTVDGNVRMISNMASLEGSVGKNVTSLANTLDMTSKGTVGGELIAVGNQASLDGRIQHDVLGLIRRTYLDGFVGGQFWLRGRNLTVASTAEIDGPATFRGRRQPTIAPGAKLASPIHVELAQEARRFRLAAIRQVVHEILSYGAALLIGLGLITVLPGFFRTTLRETRRIGLSMGVGALALIVSVVLLVLAVLLILVGVGAGIAAVLLYAPILYLAQVFVGAWLGIRIRGEGANETGAIVGRMALGLLVLHLVGLIPVLGALMWLVVGLWGTGAILLAFYRMSRAEPAPLPA
jgi:cytoskeletal protein CcmA (bactofilin family)